MIKKEQAIVVLQGLLNPDNENKVRKYIEKVNEMTDEQWQEFLRQKSINSIEEIEKIAKGLIFRRDFDEKIEINPLISYGITGNTLHIHTIPKDLKHMLSPEGLSECKQYLIQALEQIKILMQQEEYQYIDKVYAVSNIIKGPVAKVFEELNFAIRIIGMREAKNDGELKYFYEMFKGKGTRLGRATLTREQILSDEWEALKNSQKKDIVKSSHREERD